MGADPNQFQQQFMMQGAPFMMPPGQMGQMDPMMMMGQVPYGQPFMGGFRKFKFHSPESTRFLLTFCF